ncbi:ubiquitin family protein [Ceratobasidium sp. AG-Ba]|nr:ubiquitin family protein [Ceratobasidium sp. AG-Ba]
MRGISARRNQAQHNQWPFLVATYLNSSATIRRTDDYNLTISVIKSAFDGLLGMAEDRIKISAKFPGYDQNIRIIRDLWSELMPSLTEVTVTIWKVKSMLLSIETVTGKNILIPAEASDTVEMIKIKIQDKEGIPCDQQMIFTDGSLAGKRTLSDYDIRPGDTLHLRLRLRGGKPVIYLFPPTPMASVSVSLALVAAWILSVVYPPTPIQEASDGTQSVTWTVNSNPDGTLFDLRSLREVSYLFWEAHTNPALFSSSPASCVSRAGKDTRAIFDPSCPSITPSNSAFLPFNTVAGYIDDVLASLGLHTEARCSFITYWLPRLQHHNHIALRFLPRIEYEAAAPMRITPSPDVAIRIFMLFRGVEDSDVDQWGSAVKDVSEWKDIVGVDMEKATDTNNFRALKWGGMEII